MKILLKNIIPFIILFPTYLELINPSKYQFNLIGPYSVGTTLFILLGFSYIILLNKINFNSKILISFILIILGFIFGSFFSSDLVSNLSRSFGILILFIASIGFSSLWEKKFFSKFLDLFFIILFAYWAFYLLENIIQTGTFISYSLLFSEDTSIYNHHEVALPITLSSIYLLIRYFFENKKIRLYGYLFIIFTLFLLVLSESRSNLFFYLLSILILMFSTNRYSSATAVIIFTLFGLSIFLYNYLFSDYERIFQRFDVTDLQYQTLTNQIRLELLVRFPAEFINNLFGTGPLESKITISGLPYSIHNNYLTQILSGGIISLFGVLIFIKQIFNLLRNFYLYQSYFPKKLYLISSITIVYFLTLFSIEQGGLFFYFILSGFISLEKASYCNVKLKISK